MASLAIYAIIGSTEVSLQAGASDISFLNQNDVLESSHSMAKEKIGKLLGDKGFCATANAETPHFPRSRAEHCERELVPIYMHLENTTPMRCMQSSRPWDFRS
jgi:hypothetical protein